MLLHKKTDYFHIKDLSATGELVPAGCGEGKIDKLVEMLTGDKVLTLEPHLRVFEGYAGIDGTRMRHRYVYKSGDAAFDAGCGGFKGAARKSGI